MKDQWELPREHYAFPTGEQQISAEADDFYQPERLVVEGGIFLWLKDAQYPIRGWVSPEILFSVNICKSAFIEAVRVLSMPLIAPGVALSLLMPKSAEWIGAAFSRLAWRAMSPWILKDSLMTPCARSLQHFAFDLMRHSGIGEELSDRISSILAHCIEYDSAYRMRIMDVMGETSRERLMNPSSELRRLHGILSERDLSPSVALKAGKVVSLARAALLVPRIRKAWKLAVAEMDIESMRMDEADEYWACMRTDYLFMGMTVEERKERAASRGWKHPKGSTRGEAEEMASS